MVDFSEAERSGFIHAFIEFRQQEGSTRTQDDLRTAAERLLKGCKHHFESGVTRIARIAAVIPPEQEKTFRRLTNGLIHSDSLDDFYVLCGTVLREFPQVSPWFQWWMREEHATMLFQSQRRMDPILWDSLPETTNAEEAMHWTLYCMVGRDHALMEGILSLRAFVRHFEQQLASSRGMSTSFLLINVY